MADSAILITAVIRSTVFSIISGFIAALIALQIDSFNVINKQIALARGVNYIDITASTRMAATDISLVATDGLHPSGKEYNKWAVLLAAVIKSVL